MGVNHLTVDVGSPRNLGAIIRTINVLCGKSSKLFIYDPRDRLVTDIEEIKLTSTELVDKNEHEVVKDIAIFLENYKGRIVKTDLSEDAVPLPEFRFKEDDLILYGNENRGYLNKALEKVPGVYENADCSIKIPMLGENHPLPDRGKVVHPNHGEELNMNVNTVVAIVAYAALEQLGYLVKKP